MVKQGFLLRKVSQRWCIVSFVCMCASPTVPTTCWAQSEGRREWKPRRFVLSKDSDQLVFYRGSKVGVMSVGGCVMSVGGRVMSVRFAICFFLLSDQGKAPLGSIPLRGSSIVLGAGQSHPQSDDEDGHDGAVTLTIITGRGLMYHLQATTTEEMWAWHSALTQTIQTLDTTQEQ